MQKTNQDLKQLLHNLNLPRPAGAGRLDPARQAAFVTGLHHALWMSGLALLAAAALTGLLFTQRAAASAPR